jgi:hypothetical protein
MSNHWLMNTSFAYNTAIANYNSFTGANNQANATTATTTPFSDDPTNRAVRDGPTVRLPDRRQRHRQRVRQRKAAVQTERPLSAALRVQRVGLLQRAQGHPFERGILSPSRVNGGNTVFVVLDPIGDNRLPNYQNLDFHFDRRFHFGTTNVLPQLDIFNVMNSNTIQAIRGTRNASNANQIQATLAPRVLRFGVKFNW